MLPKLHQIRLFYKVWHGIMVILVVPFYPPFSSGHTSRAKRQKIELEKSIPDCLSSEKREKKKEVSDNTAAKGNKKG